MKVAVESACARSFNSVLLNYYRDGRDSVGMHSDDESELGTNPCIASLSLGETRTMVFKPRIRNGQRPVRIALESGSLLVMAGPTQSHWLHGVDKETRPCGPRVNLTFRMIRS
jgi:alkylated DNA repair dioxygenase AlkB